MMMLTVSLISARFSFLLRTFRDSAPLSGSLRAVSPLQELRLLRQTVITELFAPPDSRADRKQRVPAAPALSA